ncbi:MAG: sugar transferase [Acidimicrobiales bacterium]
MPASGIALRHPRRIAPKVFLLLVDLSAVIACELVALVLVHQPESAGAGSSFLPNLFLSFLIPVVAVGAFAANGLYVRWPNQLLLNSFTELRDITYALALTGCVVLGTHHFFGGLDRATTYDPVTIVVAVLLAAGIVPVGRAVSRAAMRATSLEQFRVIILGSGMMATQLLHYLSWDRRITVVGCVDDDPAPGTGVLGKLADLPALCDAHQIDQVIVSFSRTHPAEAIERLQSLNPGVAISIVPRFFELLSWRSSVKEIAGLALVDVAPPSLRLPSKVAKRIFDVAVGGLALVLLGPLLLAVALAVKFTSPGPVFFRQRRVGRGGEVFVVFKFRSMHASAEQERAELEATGGNVMDGPLFKLRQDPRVTRIGNLLRRSSLDELPQLFNVIRGDMSLVGPRPFVEEEAAQIAGSATRRFDVRPGMTGLWQVSGRSHLSYDELRRLDYLYVASWSMLWDLKIIWNTPGTVLKRRGAL